MADHRFSMRALRSSLASGILANRSAGYSLTTQQDISQQVSSILTNNSAGYYPSDLQDTGEQIKMVSKKRLPRYRLTGQQHTD
jgi:hypothetical protein